MAKTFIGPRLRQLRRERGQTQAEMAAALGVSTAYVNLLESNQRALSVKVLMAIADAYGVDLRDMLADDATALLADLRAATKDPLFDEMRPDGQELRAALDHAPALVRSFVQLHRSYRALLEQSMLAGATGRGRAAASPEQRLHDIFRDRHNHFPTLETLAETLRHDMALEADTAYDTLRARLRTVHRVAVTIETVEAMADALRTYDAAEGRILLSEALDHTNRVFQLAHMVGLLEGADLLDALVAESGMTTEGSGATRLRVELANYFAAALLMPYDAFLAAAEGTAYDIDRIAARFGVSFEQVCHRLTTLQREGARGIPFFFLRVDKAGNVTKRFNSTTFHLAEHGGSCPKWNLHAAFAAPGVILPQFVEMPDGERFFTLSRTTDRPTFSRDTQDRRLAVALGCELRHAERIGYAASFNLADPALTTPIGINCHLCPRHACSQRAHRPVHIDLPVDANRRGSTRLET